MQTVLHGVHMFLFSVETAWDAVHVYDGLSDQDPRLGIVTGNQRKSFNSSSRYMTVVFQSDSGWTQQGFQAEWRSIGMFQVNSFYCSNKVHQCERVCTQGLFHI